MTSTTSSVRRKKEFKEIYFWSLRKSLGIMVLTALLLFMALPMILSIIMSNEANRAAEYTMEQWTEIYSQGLLSLNLILVTPFILLMTIIVSALSFNYMHQKRSIDMYHSLPVGRTPLLLGRYFAGLTTLIVPILLNYIIVFIIGKLYYVDLKSCWMTILSTTLWLMLICTAGMIFCVFMAVCTGTTFDMILSIIGINAAYPFLIFLSGKFASILLPGLSISLNPDTIILTAITPFAAAFMPYFGDRRFHTFRSIESTLFIWWILMTLILLFVTVFLYKKRKSESSENNFAFSIPKHIIRFIITASAGLGFGLLLNRATDNPANFFIGVLSGSLAAHIVTQVIFSRGFKKMKKSFSYYGIFVGVFLIAYAILATGCFGYDKNLPRAEDVTSIRINNYYDNNYTYQIYDENKRPLTDLYPVLKDPQSIAKVVDIHKKVITERRSKRYPYLISKNDSPRFEIIYNLKNGGTLKRSYCMQYDTYKSDAQVDFPVSDITNLREYRENNSFLFYIEPEYIKSFDINTKMEWDPNTFSPDINLKKKLLDALRQDSLNGVIEKAEHNNDIKDPVYISIECKEPILLKDGKLKSFLNNYTGKIYLSDHEGAQPRRNYWLPQSGSETVSLLRKLGWDK